MAKLAICGGTAEAAELIKRIPPWPRQYKGDREVLLQVLESGRWCRLYSGSRVEEFEKDFAKFHQARFGVAVSNGTTALQLALRAAGIGVGDEVLVPAVTFIATAVAVVEVGAIPIFVDIDPRTASISAESIELAITPRTRAAIVVHYGGYPVDFDLILPVVKKHNLVLIEDCAHAHASEWKGHKVGSLGDFGCFSFQETKSLCAGEGGIVLTNGEKWFERLYLMHNIGRIVGRPDYEHYLLSSNYRMTEFQGALLHYRLKYLPEETEIKYQKGEFLAAEFSKIGGIEPLPRDSRISKRGYYFFILRYDSHQFKGVSRDRFLSALQAEGVPAAKGYGVPLYRQPAFKKEKLQNILPEKLGPIPDYEKLYLPVAEEFCSHQQITLLHPILLADREALWMIINSVAKIKENAGELLEHR